MSKTYALQAEAREPAGKGAARSVRRDSKIPAVIYGDKKEPVSIMLDSNTLNLEYRKGHMFTNICTLSVAGADHQVLARDLQICPLKGVVLHADFLRVTPRTMIHVSVPVHVINEDMSPGLTLNKGLLNIGYHELEVICQATNIPEVIEIDLAGKNIGDSIHMQDLTLPEGTKPASNRNLDAGFHRRTAPYRGRGSRGGRGCSRCRCSGTSRQKITIRHGARCLFAFTAGAPVSCRRSCVLWLALTHVVMAAESRPDMWLIAGLGNPGGEYERHRHNIGFMATEALAAHYGLPQFRVKFNGLISEGRIGAQKVVLLKPQTFMNDSGLSVGQTAKFYKILPNHILALHDELDIPAGTVKVKQGGGHAGHNGLRSLDSHLGQQDYWRVRLGIGHPGGKAEVHNYVLGDFAKSELPQVEAMVKSVVAHIGLLLDGRGSAFTGKVVADMAPPV